MNLVRHRPSAPIRHSTGLFRPILPVSIFCKLEHSAVSTVGCRVEAAFNGRGLAENCPTSHSTRSVALGSSKLAL
jgi:hypothetical protein